MNHLLGEMLKLETGIRILHVPYKGVAQLITDVMSGQVDSGFASVPSVLPHVNTGRVRAIAVSSAKRSEAEFRQTKLFAVEQLRFERSRAYQRRNRLRRDSVRRAALLRYVHEDSVR